MTTTQSLVLVLTAVIIVAEIILLFKISKGKHKKIDGLAINKNQETASFRSIIEKIEDLEAEKKSLIIEIEELKKTADAKATALESEVNALRDEMKAQKSLMNGSEPSVDAKLKKNHKDNRPKN